MNKKLIVLMLLMPLLLMVSIYTSTNSSSLNVKISVNKIEITGDDIVYLNLEQDEKYFKTGRTVVITIDWENGVIDLSALPLLSNWLGVHPVE